jgi:hypothetical protein
MSKTLAIRESQRHAFDRLARKYHERIALSTVTDANGKKHELPDLSGPNGQPTKKYFENEWHVKPENITCPSIICQELPLNGSTNALTFNFSQTAPQQTTALNNTLLGINDIFVIYGIQVLFGVGALGVTRQYFTHGLLAADNAIYQGATMSMQFEQSQNIKNIDMNDFLYNETTDYKPEEVIKLVNPLRMITGRLGTFNIVINMQPLTGLTFTPNAYVSVRLHGALGQASGS